MGARNTTPNAYKAAKTAEVEIKCAILYFLELFLTMLLPSGIYIADQGEHPLPALLEYN